MTPYAAPTLPRPVWLPNRSAVNEALTELKGFFHNDVKQSLTGSARVHRRARPLATKRRR